VNFAKPFAISRYQVNAGKLDPYLKDNDVKLAHRITRPSRECIAYKTRKQKVPRQPAMDIVYSDVKNYDCWLSKKTGEHYH
ncbi:SUMF1/EgtB/PvdO family nonheme iron enzyme, partial [Pseudomonas aeruginosa]